MRTKNALRNLVVMIIAQSFNVIFVFVSRTIFIQLLPIEYLGISGLFANIFSVLSLSELGIGSTIIIHLYDPINKRDFDKVAQLMNFYALSYRIIGCVILIIGIILVPFVPILVKNSNIENLSLIYLIFVVQSASSYFFSYKQSLLIALQKEYINIINFQLFSLLKNVFQIIILISTNNFILYLLVSVLITILSNMSISLYVNKNFNMYLSKKKTLSKMQIYSLLKSVGSMSSHKIGNVVINSTDNIVISYFLGVFWVGLYSNYLLIVNIIAQFVRMVFSSTSASIGDYNASSDSVKIEKMFFNMMFMAMWLYGFTSICFLVLFQPFIRFWIGQKFMLDFSTLFVIVCNYFFYGVLLIPNSFIEFAKLFDKTKIKPWLMVVTNLGFSIVLVNILGIKGVFIGTLISYLCIGLWIDALVLYRHYFKAPARIFFVYFFNKLIVIIATGVIVYSISLLTNSLLIKFSISLILPNVFFYLFFRNDVEFREIILRVKLVMRIS